ncbi:Golgi reassembly-stacking protein 2-like [Corythoichthys intestinalis]|uniref:Golgi reassembly-stacking protein 2-like n=1 Tax=Corythoichthys intestinalis TaxID=161448 RepID=UPI0025A52ADA|nr:Golgi reassembly-stacking protein 2-like [Corythoichthys intestinalis]
MGGFASVQVPGGGNEGYQILKMQHNSPGYCAGLEPFFDFIIAICDTRLSKDDDTLKDALERNVDKPTKLILYSCRTLGVRETMVTPSTMWGGRGLLGVSICFSNFQGARENVWHVLEVEPNSPAAQAGLQSYTDYIIGAETLLDKNDCLFKLINDHEGRLLKLFVYNTDTCDCREVHVWPNHNWGGAGSLGCEIGYGYMHRVPSTPFAKNRKQENDVGLTAVVTTVPASVSSGSEKTDTAFDPTSVQADHLPPKQSITVSASSSEHSLLTSSANSAITQDEASPSTVVQMISLDSPTNITWSVDTWRSQTV